MNARDASLARDALDGAITAFTGARLETPRLDAEVLFASVLGVSRERLLTDDSLAVTGPDVHALREAVRRRAIEREPVAYIIGRKGFRTIELNVDSRALIPRPETETLVEVGLQLPRGSSVLDLGTGSGAIALALALERPDLDIYASDVSKEALTLARENAARLGLEVSFLQADLLAGTPPQVDAVLANPPYVAVRDRLALAPEITRHEPALALFAGKDGLDVIRRLIAEAAARDSLRLLAIEVGAGQAAEVRELMRLSGFERTRSIRDLAGIERVVVAQKR